MNVPTRPNPVLTHQALLYDRALHPELLPVRTKRIIKGDGYELEAWLMPGSHALGFTGGGQHATELFADSGRNLPTAGVLSAFLAAGEHEFEHTFTPTPTHSPTPTPAGGANGVGTNGHANGHAHAAGVGASLTYMLSVQTEQLADNLFADVYREMLDLAKEESPLMHHWHDDAGKCLSMISIQRQQKQVHAQAYHLIATGSLVIRTQSIFELA